MKTKETTKAERCELRLPTNLKEKLDEYCKENHTNMSSVIRELLETRLDNNSSTSQTDLIIFMNKVHNRTLHMPKLNKVITEIMLEEASNNE